MRLQISATSGHDGAVVGMYMRTYLECSGDGYEQRVMLGQDAAHWLGGETDTPADGERVTAGREMGNLQVGVSGVRIAMAKWWCLSTRSRVSPRTGKEERLACFETWTPQALWRRQFVYP